MGMEVNVSARPGRAASYQRARQDIDPWRLALALAVAPVSPIVLGGVLSVLNSGAMLSVVAGPWVPSLRFLFMAVSAEFWSVAFGVLYLMTSRRRSGVITRGNCLFVGGLAAVLFVPMLTLVFIIGTTGLAGADLLMMALPFSLLGGLFLSPLGVLGGWTFWLIGVRPAKLRTVGIERVFE
jgi:hypothetical protein